jgi:hypothetical protein
MNRIKRLSISVMFFIALLVVSPAFANEVFNGAEISGDACNITVNKHTGVKFRLEESADGKWRAVGEYDGINLFGKFDVPGRVLERFKGGASMQFEGDLDLSNIGGWKEGTHVPYDMTLCFTQGECLGVYHIDPIGDYNYNQYGVLKLNSDRGLLKKLMVKEE